MGDRRGFFNSLHLSFSSSNLPIASQEFAPRKGEKDWYTKVSYTRHNN